MFFIIIILLAFFLQASGIFIVFDTGCNFLLIATVFVSLKLAPDKGGFFGFFCGLLLDCIGIRHFGIHTLSLTIIGIGTSILSKRIYPRIDVLLLILFLGTMIFGIISLFLFYVLEGFVLNLLSILKEALYNTIIGGLILLFIRKKLYEKKD